MEGGKLWIKLGKQWFSLFAEVSWLQLYMYVVKQLNSSTLNLASSLKY